MICLGIDSAEKVAAATSFMTRGGITGNPGESENLVKFLIALTPKRQQPLIENFPFQIFPEFIRIFNVRVVAGIKFYAL
jgi:hypothetical protein